MAEEDNFTKKFPQILDLSAKFVMVNAGDDDEPSEELYKPDGGYIPR